MRHHPDETYIQIYRPLHGPLVQISHLVSEICSRSWEKLTESRPCFLGHSSHSAFRQWEEFVNEIVRDLIKQWPGNVTVVNGRPRNPRCQGLVEQGNSTVEKLLGACLNEYQQHDDHTSWADWIPLIQCKYCDVTSQRILNTSIRISTQIN